MIKMKNKKLLTRLFALLASLVLVFALAFPCFADVVEGDTTYVIDTISFTDRESLYNWLAENYIRVVDCYFDSTMFDHIVRFDNVVIYDEETFAFYYTDVLSDSTNDVYNAIPLFTVVRLNSISMSYLSSATITGGNGQMVDFSDSMWSQLSVVVTINYLSPIENGGGSIDPTAPSSDIYSNLFNILKDAVYGSDAELTGSQEYALTLISTILTYATILLPVILVIFIAVWCFKRF